MEEALRKLCDAVVQGDFDGVKTNVQASLDAKLDPNIVLNDGMHDRGDARSGCTLRSRRLLCARDVDRGNMKVANLFQPLHPAFLRLIQQTISAAHAHGKSVGMCGELAGMQKAIPILLGFGLDEFSMNPRAISGRNTSLVN
ncbi:MAG: putative PEP-binding protein [Chloroflexota bacterium]